jgi:hypothetical protein
MVPLELAAAVGEDFRDGLQAAGRCDRRGDLGAVQRDVDRRAVVLTW